MCLYTHTHTHTHTYTIHGFMNPLEVLEDFPLHKGELLYVQMDIQTYRQKIWRKIYHVVADF